MSIPDPSTVLELIDAFRRSKTMFAAVALGVFDDLERGPSGASALANQLHVKKEALEQLLNGCVGLGLLSKDGDRYANVPAASTFLCSSSPHALTGYIRYSNEVLFRLWTHLEDAVGEGGHRWKQIFGAEGPIFSHFFRTDEDMRVFLKGMHGMGMLSSPAIASAFDLTRFQCVADLGGATGHLAMAICERYAGLQAVVFDLPPVIAVARDSVAQSPAVDRITFVAGDLFQDTFPNADLFAFGRILHDWTEAKVRTLLSKAYESLPPGGAVLIAEKFLAEDKTGPIPALMQSLNMLVATEGRERTLDEYRRLLQSAGFRDVRGHVTRTPLDAVFAVKPRHTF